MSNDLSIDCETGGTDFDAPIFSIGARFFDKTTGKFGDKFYIEIALSSMFSPYQRSFRVSGDTLQWWMRQSDGARKLFAKDDKDKKTLASALLDLNHWIIKESGTGPLKVWANGPSQDVTWIDHAYTVGGVGLAKPWGYNAPRDMRTITDLAGELVGWEWSSVKPVGTAHNALHDADYQANVISSAFAALRKNCNNPENVDDL